MVLMVPTVELPPLTLSTDQVTAVFVVPVTLAVNGVVLVMATLAVAWFNATLTTGGGGWIVEELLFILEQPTSVKAIARRRQGPENFLTNALDFVALIRFHRVSESTSREVDDPQGLRVAAYRVTRRRMSYWEENYSGSCTTLFSMAVMFMARPNTSRIVITFFRESYVAPLLSVD